MPEGKRTQRKLTPLHHQDKPCSFLANFVDRKKRFRTAGFCFDGEANAKYYCTAAKGRLAAVGQPYRKLSAPGATWVNASRRMFPRVDVPLDLRFFLARHKGRYNCHQRSNASVSNGARRRGACVCSTAQASPSQRLFEGVAGRAHPGGGIVLNWLRAVGPGLHMRAVRPGFTPRGGGRVIL